MNKFLKTIKSILRNVLIVLKNNWKQLILLTVVLVLFFLFSFDNIKRLIISLKYFFQSMYYYIVADSDNPLTLQVPLDYLIEDAGGNILNLIPIDFQVIVKKFKVFGALLINQTFWKNIGFDLSLKFDKAIIFINLGFLILAFIFLLSLTRKYKKNEIPEDTKILTWYKSHLRKFLSNKWILIKSWSKKFFKKWITISLIIIFCIYLNLPVLLLDLLSNYFHFLGTIMDRTFNFNIIWKGLLTVLLDFISKWLTIPLLLRLLGYYLLFDFLRIKSADKGQQKRMDADEEFLEQSGQQILFLGVSGAGKNALAVTLGVIYEQISFPKILINTMLDVQKRFPDTNWSKWMDEVTFLKDNGSFKNQLDIFTYIAILDKKYRSTKDNRILYLDLNAQFQKWDGLKIEKFIEALRDWILAYFLYIHDNPFAVANYTIMFNDKTNPKPHYFNLDKTKILKETQEDYLKRKTCVRVNYDFARPGMKFANYDKSNNFVYDFGGFFFTEFGKERGTSDAVKKESGETMRVNRSNDKMTENFKTWRHGATLRYKPAFKIICDEQKNTGINKETRGTFETIITLDTGNIKKKFGLKHWWFEQFICKWIFQHFDNYILKRQEIKMRKSLPNYFICKIVTRLYFYYIKRINTYSYSECTVYQSNGSLEDVKQEEYSTNKLYIINKIAYAGRYNTANLHKAYLDRMAGSKVGFDDQPRFKTLTPSPTEWSDMNSFAAQSIFNIKY